MIRNQKLIMKLLLLLLLPISLLAQETSISNTSDFDRETFKEQSYDMVDLFSSELYASSEHITLLTVSSNYEMDGIGSKSSNDSSVVANWVKNKYIQSEKLIEIKELTAGTETREYIFDHLNPETFITIRSISKDKVQVKLYGLVFE